MKTLLISRHAKSSWADAALADFDRPLNERGLRAAPFMGELMLRKGFSPAIILSSPAVLARTTAELLKQSGSLEAEIRFDHRIYEASPQSLRNVVAEFDDSIESAMLVGHNPGIEGFIRFLTGQLEPMPTAALAVIDLYVDKWRAIDDGCAELKSVFRPKDEMGKRGLTD